MNELIPIQNLISVVRGQKVMLDSDLAMLYEVETKNLNRAVKRNINRFPENFMFQLTDIEWEALKVRCPIVTSPKGGGRQYLPYVFTEQGVAMLSSVLHSEKAIQVNIQIMNTFVKMLISWIIGSSTVYIRLILPWQKFSLITTVSQGRVSLRFTLAKIRWAIENKEIAQRLTELEHYFMEHCKDNKADIRELKEAMEAKIGRASCRERV